jgi:hypothetical protein
MKALALAQLALWIAFLINYLELRDLRRKIK